MHPQIETFLSSLNAIGMKVNTTKTGIESIPLKCYYRNNPDGTVRWIWPASAKTAGFLKFYHILGWRAKLFSMICECMVRTGLHFTISHGKLDLFISSNNNSATNGNILNWAYFSGTVGPNRKAIFWTQNRANQSVFYKIPLTTQSITNVENEALKILQFTNDDIAEIVLPEIETYASGILRQQDIGVDTTKTNRIAEIPVAALQQWLKTDLKAVKMTSSKVVGEISSYIQNARTVNDARISDSLFKKLQLISDSLSKEEEILSAAAHGDFTPWNMMLKGEKLHMIDWEMSKANMPVLFDLFHFVYQSNILIGNKGYLAIRAELNNLFTKPQWRKFIAENKIDTDKAEQWYLTYTVAYYLDLYSTQSKWHVQVQWLLATWNDAMNFYLASVRLMPLRKIVLNDLSFLLNDQNYAVLKWRNTTLDSLPDTSDIDICMAKDDASHLIKQLRKNPLLQITCLKRRSHMTQVQMIMADGSLLHLDFLHKFKRRATIFMNAKKVILSAEKNEFGFKVPLPEHDFSYTWMFYWLNKAEVPQHYRLKFSSMPLLRQLRITKYVEANYFHNINDFSDLFNLKKGHRKSLVHQLRAAGENRGFLRLYNVVSYLADSLKNEFPSNGFIVTFSGVDGAGKSTVIENIREMADKVLRQKVVVLRHRPSVLPIISSYKYGKENAELKSAQSLPRQGNNSSTFSSLLRFAYYYADYLFGQLYIHMRYVRRGYIVLYDRYYFDFINDGRRSNINLSPAFTKWWYRFLIKPRLNFFLYADEQTILRRKQELKPEDIRQLTGDYLKLFNQLQLNSGSAKYISLENKVLPETVETIFYQIKKQAV